MVGVAAVPVTVVSLPAEDGPKNEAWPQAGPEDCGERRTTWALAGSDRCLKSFSGGRLTCGDRQGSVV